MGRIRRMSVCGEFECEGKGPLSEKDIENWVLTALEPHFVITRRVPGIHFSGKRLVIDAVVVPRAIQRWKNPHVALGIEFKDVARLRGDTRHFTRWFSQCVDYSYTNWTEYGYIFIFACPSLVKEIPAGDVAREDIDRIMGAVMGQLGIGELRYSGHLGWHFVLHNRHRIWSEELGVEEGRRYWLKREFGSKS